MADASFPDSSSSGDSETPGSDASPGRPAPGTSPAEEEAASAPHAPASDAAEHTRERLLGYVSSVYALAQTLAGSEAAARRLVEGTYARAATALRDGEGPPAGDEADEHGLRTWLFALLVHTARSGGANGARDASEEREGAERGDARDRHYRQRAQKRFLRRSLPAAFASLAPEQRLLLTLCDVEGLRPLDAVAVAGSDTPSTSPEATESAAGRRVATARADLRDALYQMAPRPERPFLEANALPDGRLRDALARMARRELATPPSALRPAARHALQHPLRQASPEAETEAAPDAPAPVSVAEVPGEDAADRAPVAPKQRQASSWSGRLPRLAVALVLILGTGAAAYFASAFLDTPETTALTALTARQATDVDVRLRTEQPERAEQFVRDELGRRLSVPRIRGAVLRGVGLAEAAPGERVPAFLFRDTASGHPLTAYAYDYALLDRAEGRLDLPPHLRNQIEQQGRFATEEVDGRRVLLWRDRDDIFAAVTEPADSLEQRIGL